MSSMDGGDDDNNSEFEDDYLEDMDPDYLDDFSDQNLRNQVYSDFNICANSNYSKCDD